MRNVLMLLLAGLCTLVIVDAAHRSHARPAAVERATLPVVPAPPSAPVVVNPVPVVVTTPPVVGTPTLDMLARLAVRRRLMREGNLVYLDSLFPHTDSVLIRWPDRSSLAVRLVTDTTLPGWTPALLDEARTGMRAWQDNPAGIVLREATDADSADIIVHWVVALPDSGQVGLTALQWGTDDAIRSADVTLALRRGFDSLVVPPEVRARVAAHEFGPALGLPHSDDVEDLMYRTSPVAMPTFRDQATMRLLYALPAGPLKIQLP
jgi:hypothetical protein